MLELWLILTPILILDILNPLLLAALTHALLSRHPYLNSISLLFSFHTTYFIAGLIVTVGLDYLTFAHSMPQGVHYLLGFIVGLLIIYFAWRQYNEGYDDPEETIDLVEEFNVVSAFSMGIRINIIDLPYAMPYLGAMLQILIADLTPMGNVVALFLYNVLYSLPFLAAVVIRFVSSRNAEIFEKANKKLGYVTEYFRPLMDSAVGLFFLNQSITYFMGS